MSEETIIEGEATEVPEEEPTGDETVMVRVNDDALKHLDMLVEADITKSRSESAAFLITEGVKDNQELFEKIGNITDQIAELRAQLRETVTLDVEE
jgi:hypothetical protein